MSGEKFIHIKFNNGDIFRIEADLVIRDKVKYALDLAYKENPQADLNSLSVELYRSFYHQHEQLSEHLRYRMTWEDIREFATLVHSEKYDYADKFYSARHEVLYE